ncbi:PTS transporter subunit EIIC [Clostridium sp. SYSU_GA19001]|uniref:PTS sugar transporter subunit IIC n=1 Tax=Clostridium caldaquaticum TaxID=2940653 RepID=UPI0020771D9A|nr:PTS transporter subunit EIIC [Clostridium caldaquaticum]MCM8711884.1 PTS transporter subunit EIIC [Clostridium caldaquaticum]
MEKLFESKFMIKLQDFGQKLGSNKFLAALQAAMMSLMGIIMVGAISQILCSLGSETMLNLFSSKSKIYSTLYLPYQFTMNCLSVWVVALLAFNYAKNLKMKSPIMNAVDALVCFLLISGSLITTEAGITGISMTYLGAQGMFIGFIVVFISVHIEKYCADKNIRIKMPDVVPPFLKDGFSAILPLLFNIILFLVVSTVVVSATGGAYNICSGFMKILGVPLNALTSVPGMFVLCIFGAILWCFGIHGTMILIPIIMPLGIQATVANAALHEAGKPLVFYPVALFGAIATCGGTGNTLPLVLMGLRSKSKQIKAVAKVSVVPGWFGINEPVTFGMPIMYNPVLCIPYILNIPFVMICTYFGYKLGFLTPGWISISALLPMGFGRYLSTLKWQNAIWDYLMLIPAAIVWYPFFKIYEKQLVAQESAALAEEAYDGTITM